MPEKNLPRVVVDTSVLVSALIGKSLRQFILLLQEQKFRLVFSESTLEELVFVLQRPKFRKYFSQEDISEFLYLLSFYSETIVPNEKITDCRDPKDNIFLEVAVSTGADFIVSSDTDLLELNPFRTIKIISPKEFFDIIQQQNIKNQ